MMAATTWLGLIATLLLQHQILYTDALQIRSTPNLRVSGHRLQRAHQAAAPPCQRCLASPWQQQQRHYISPLDATKQPVLHGERNETLSAAAAKQQTAKSRFSTARIPKWISTIRTFGPKRQFVVVIALYIFHITVLAQRQVVFPMQLIPNDNHHFTGIGWDSIAGMLTLASYCVFRKRAVTTTTVAAQSADRNSTSINASSISSTLPSIWSTPTESETPWNLPNESIRHRLSSLITAAVLIQTYFFTGRFSIFWEDQVYNLSGLGFYITAPMQRSLCVLLGHLSWLTTGTLLLKWLPRPPRFFGNNTPLATMSSSSSPKEDDDTAQEKTDQQSARWFQSSRNAYWMWWVIGGYFVSSWLFNVADLVNHYILPPSVLADAQESVVTQLINPEHNGLAASFVGYIAPCLTAPWWEEVLYRGFGLAGLSQLLGYKWAVFLQGVIFSAHHMSLTAALPLAVLGWTWAILYTKSRNLWTVVLVHALWNSRVFLGSWLGL
jgi:membrane protease YdiL (CAAX protease family)